ncbi:unnamed protein product [Oppiella nova]|uniref:Arrestin C-terminal-like domain-containing protein n=1 Tax=Oppiella nova TaxID=334625 RepID=A0A7R9MBV7_9ACAR|nr:unnamed protein product [Oppiella nova]CAG2174531.1 unnamed protein product [Oppiella nova]
MDGTIERRAYYPGEVIPVVCNVGNQSSTRVIPRVTLRQTQTYIVPIPADVAISGDCPILMVTYDLHLTADIPSARDLHVNIPVIITTLNIVNQVSQCLLDGLDELEGLDGLDGLDGRRRQLIF